MPGTSLNVSMKPGANMKLLIIGMILPFLGVATSFAQSPSAEAEIIRLSRAKWQWMADKNVDSLAVLFHDKARFVHMSGTWGKATELEIIRSGSIHYRQADVHDVAVETTGDTAVLWNRITLLALVRGAEVTTEFTVTEVYVKQGEQWKLLALTFSSVRDTHVIER
jgi:hypothetical protein